jgi:ferritin-like metal-binding protein YciE
MQTEKHLAQHDSQIARLEQVMTALAEAQVKTEDSTERLNVAMAELACSQRDLLRQWQAYLNTIRPQ